MADTSPSTPHNVSSSSLSPASTSTADPTPEFSAFISYASRDRDKAQEISNTLEARGLKCWIAPRDVRAGREYGEEIVEGIRRSRCLVLVLSDAANQSPMVRREVERAVSLNKPVFPIRVEEVLPARSLEFFVSATHWIDAWSGMLVDHAIRLADQITDERQFGEVQGELRRRRKRRQLPKWIAAFVLVLAAIVIGSWLSNQMGGARETIVYDRSGDVPLDFGTLRADQFSVATRPGMLTGPNQGRLEVTVPELLDGIMGQGGLMFRVGSRPWKIVLTDIRTGSYYGVLDPKDLQAGGPVQLQLNERIVGRGVTAGGPFTFELNVGSSVSQQQHSAAATRTDWLRRYGNRWQIDPRIFLEVADVVRAVKFGGDPQHLDVRAELPRKPGADATQRDAARYLASIASFGGRIDLSTLDGRDTVYAQFEFLEGASGPVLTIKHDGGPADSVGDSRRAVDDWNQRKAREALAGPWLADERDNDGSISLRLLEPALDQIARVRLGEKRDQLDHIVQVLGENEGKDRIDPFFVRRGDWRSFKLPVAPGATTVHAQLEFLDGTRSEVRDFDVSPLKFSLIEFPVVAAPGHAAAPRLYGTYSENRAGLNFFATSPPGTKRMIAALDNTSFGEVAKSGWWSDRGFRFRQWQTSRTIRIIFQQENGVEYGPVTYALEGVEEFVRASYKSAAIERRREAIVAYRFPFAYSRERPPAANAPLEQRRQFNYRDSAVTRTIGGFPGAETIETPGIVVIPDYRNNERPMWAAVRAVRLGRVADNLSVTVPVTSNIDELLKSSSGWSADPWLKSYPPETDSIHARLVFSDNTESATFEVSIVTIDDPMP